MRYIMEALARLRQARLEAKIDTVRASTPTECETNAKKQGRDLVEREGLEPSTPAL